MGSSPRIPVRRPLPESLPRVAVLAIALSVILLLALLAEARTAPSPTPVPGAVEMSPAAGGACTYLDPTDRDLRVLFVGDSMTQGRSGSATYRYWVWRGLVTERDDVDFVGPRTTLNGDAGQDAYEHLDYGFDEQLQHAGQAGATFESSRAQFPPAQLVRDHSPDVIVLQLGFNDSNRERATPEQLAAKFGDYMDAVWAEAPETRFVLGQIPSAEGTPATREKTADRNRRTAATDALLTREWRSEPCKVQVNRLRSGGAPEWDSRVNTYDGAHPDPSGETLMADRMLAALGRLGVLREDPVDVYQPDELWTPEPFITVGPGSAVGRIKVDWADEMARLSATKLRLRIGSEDDYRITPWYTTRSVDLNLGSGTHEIRAIVGRGLPGRMVSEPSEPRTIAVP